MNRYIIVLLLLLPVNLVHAQVVTTVYDGLIGIEHNFKNDTFYIMDVAKGRAAEKYGIRAGDIIVYVDSTKITGSGLKIDEIDHLLQMDEIDHLFMRSAGQPVLLKIKRPRVDSLLDITVITELTLSLDHLCSFEYLVDTTGHWTIQDIVSDSVMKLFSKPDEQQILVHSVNDGSYADELGIKPGDKMISLQDQLQLSFLDLIELYISYIVDSQLVLLRDTLEIVKEIDYRRLYINDMGALHGGDSRMV